MNFFTHLSIRANVAMDQARTAALATVARKAARGVALRRTQGCQRRRDVTIGQLSCRPEWVAGLSLYEGSGYREGRSKRMMLSPAAVVLGTGRKA